MTIKWIAILVMLMLVGAAQAVPTVGAASGITSNSFNVTLSGSDGGDTWIAWGQASGRNNWASQIQTGNGDFYVYGAPIIGGTTVYYKGCDSTGCGNELTVPIPAITTMPTPTFGRIFTNLTNQHFSMTAIPGALVAAYTATQVSITIFAGIAFFFLFFGFWFRTKSVRLALVLGLLMAVFIITPTAGLMLGAPILFQFVAQGLMAAAIAGVLVAFIRK